MMSMLVKQKAGFCASSLVLFGGCKRWFSRAWVITDKFVFGKASYIINENM